VRGGFVVLRSFVAGLRFVALLGGCSNAGTTNTSPPTTPSVPATTTSVVDPSPSTPEEATPTTTSATTTKVVTTTTVAATTTTTTTTEPIAGFVVRGDGLGMVSFGDPMSQVMVVLTEHLGAPSNDDAIDAADVSSASGGDSGFNACQSVTGYPCFAYARFVAWDTAGLSVAFMDVTVNEGAEPGGGLVQGSPNLRGYGYWGYSAQTPQGLTVGSTVAELESLGGLVTYGSDACGDSVGFTVDDPDPENGGPIMGELYGVDWQTFVETGYVDPVATVGNIHAGARSSC
jgi:hypothetical protein